MKSLKCRMATYGSRLLLVNDDVFGMLLQGREVQKEKANSARQAQPALCNLPVDSTSCWCFPNHDKRMKRRKQAVAIKTSKEPAMGSCFPSLFTTAPMRGKQRERANKTRNAAAVRLCSFGDLSIIEAINLLYIVITISSSIE
jgi:hypothetical protein